MSDCMDLNREDLEKYSCYEIAHKLKDAGAPIEFNIFNVNLKPNEIKITGELESHSDIKGGVTYVWGMR